jgi:hypothetical protein
MNKTTESDIYKLIKKAVVNLKLNCHLTRVESGYTLQGIPDIYIAYHSKLVNKSVAFWLEIKSNNIKNCNLSKYQINWILKHNKSNGLVFILNKTLSQSTLKLYRLDPCAVLREVLSTDYSVDGVFNVLEYIATQHSYVATQG